MEERKDHYETCDCDDCIFQGRRCAMYRNGDELCDNFVSYTSRDRIKSELTAVDIQKMAQAGIPITRKMTREEEIKQVADEYIGYPCDIDEDYGTTFGRRAFKDGVEWADSHPSDETIMLILNCIGYEEKSWVEFVRKELKRRK